MKSSFLKWQGVFSAILLRRFVRFVAVGVVVASLIGCATARHVQIVPGEGGELTVQPENSAEARQKAEQLIRANCRGKRFKIVSEGDVVVGKSVSSRGNISASQGFQPGINTSNDISSGDITEWRIKYRCEK